VSKIIRDDDDELPDSDGLLKTHMMEVLNKIEKRLPNKNKKHLHFQVIHSLFAFTAGAAVLDSKILESFEDARLETSWEMLFALLDYTSHGIVSSESSLEKINIDFWLNFFTRHGIELS